MALPMTPDDRIQRDGFREKRLEELGVEAEVRWLGPEQSATVVLDVADLDRLIGYRRDPSTIPSNGRTVQSIEARGVDRCLRAVKALRWRHISKATVLAAIEAQR